MNTFIRIAEVWTPSSDGSVLELAGGLFDGALAFEAITRSMCFAHGEGLPGRAWEAGHPILLRRLEGSYFKRAAAAKAFDLTCAVACPVFLSDRLSCVVVLLFGQARAHVGAVELWHNDPRLSPDLRLAEGYFGTGSAELEDLTRDSWLPIGSGAPGIAWQEELSVFIDDVSSSRHFLRGPEAAAAGIARALAIPCSVLGGDTWVLGLLSSRVTPIARRIETWRLGADANSLHRAAGVCESAGTLSCEEEACWPIEAMGAIGLAWRTAIAQASPDNTTHAALSPEQAGTFHLESMLVLPVVVDDEVAEVVALYF
jgi:hypothetical protein